MDLKQRTDKPATNTRKRLEERREPRYHVYIRLPFNRGDFVDPGTVNWNEIKSDALWAVLSDSSLGHVDCTKLATQFDVTVDFLLQMANYLTERHTSQLRAHMLKAAAARGSNAPSPVPGAEPPATHQPTVTEPSRRSSSAAGRAPSALSVRKETGTPLPRNEEDQGDVAAAAGTFNKITLPVRPGSSRNSSASTATTMQNLQNQPTSRPGTAPRLSDPRKRWLPRLATTALPQQQYQPPQEETDTERPPPSPTASTSSSSTSSSDSPVQSRIIRRPPRFQVRDPRTGGGGGNGGAAFGDDDDDGDDAEPAFLPYTQRHQPGSAVHGSSGTGSISSGQDLGATLRGDMRDPAGRRRSGDAASQSQTSDSSVGSVAVVPRRPSTVDAGTGGVRASGGERRGPSGQLLSPRRTAELAARGQGLSAASRGRGASREGSEGTPSMGSSFSDLDDASVTQSALEEALASRMQDGTIGSRMSVIGGTIGAIRSRYLPKPNRQ
ncbi:hypothetical protein N657DRAFT_689392 [Parathielavia appendiculata]|uniref:Autophagy-related protein 29 n=1 Tax=Parathielavia appendiculata TaxID=2587402 RepID=A0AAN6U3A0_9PEZI|nr:hypothetical protein N657DRAFT_689392 [Parathielavia appendiculata]